MTDSDAKILSQIESCKNKLKEYDEDYKVLQACKQELASSTLLLGDFLTQCDDIKNIFDRKKIEDKYDAYNITFKGKDLTFENLDNIATETDNFYMYCEALKKTVDGYGASFDKKCKEIADKANQVSNDITTLTFRLSFDTASKIGGWGQ